MVSQYNSEPMLESISRDLMNISFVYEYERPVYVERFYRYENVLDMIFSFELTENIPVSIIFQSEDKNARFYMYGLESLSDERIETDENGDIYLKPSSTPVVLYTKDYYPLIPGVYLAKVFVEGKTYFNPFVIRPKQVTEDQLEVIKRDLEGLMRGLAIDFVKKVYSPADSQIKALPPQLLRQFMIIKKHYPTVMAALMDIYQKANYRIRKGYQWTKENRSKKIDHVTLRTQQTKSLHDGDLFTPYSAIDYDLPENRWVKFIVRNVMALLDQFEEAMNFYKDRLIQEIVELERYQFQESTRRELEEKERVSSFLEEYRLLVHRMKIGFHMIVHAPWYQEITNKTFTHIPHNLLSDSRYRALYQLHRDIISEEMEVYFDPAFTYQWKRTDKLYEMWGYFQVLKLLTEFGFQPKSGWFFDRLGQDESLLIPFLPNGECIVLIKNDMRIHYVYDGVLPLAGRETNLERAPLYMGKNNRPDGRVDFYKRDVYVGSLMIDFKYRPINNFWRNGSHNLMNRPREMEQLIAYKRDSNSKYLYGEEEGRHIRELLSPRPVREVWALYAEARADWQSQQLISDDSICIFPMNPAQDLTIIKERLQDIIDVMNSVLDRVLNKN
ncbi:DUF2357 domain-containing protein [Cohnella phaseoli]|uniref:Uncharacterized protein DUF2357 n=1 Tax=Cohnella phaseoli TaxID=456490 RepID=A0A3D9IBU2_9BACL|nr:DUF2357 domain-containing protein [Cohnella phaseoli]RED59157.1 uncharacterized protein DUF2357 [Cohnella phaseoli]